MPHTPPAHIDGTPVEALPTVLEANGEKWVTLMPPGDDDRLWEFSLTTGRIIQTQS